MSIPKALQTGTILDEIVAHKRQEIAACQQRLPAAELRAQLADLPPCRGFAAAIHAAAQERPAVIAELKRGSPSLGCIRPELGAAEQVGAYARGGATALSVLTDERFFFGGDDDLRAARQAVDLPILRKDFVIDPYQVDESRVLGADCILLIMAILPDALAAALAARAQGLGLDVLAEAHDAHEIARAVDHVDYDLLGINNRNLKTFETNTEHTLDLLQQVPDPDCLVAESGLHTPADIRRFWDQGIRRFLVGTAFVKSDDPETLVRQFVDAPNHK